MRCLSPYSRYSIQVFGADEKLIMDTRGYGTYVPTREPVIAMFDKLGLMEHEQDLALKSFDFSGLPEGVHPLTRVGVFDTEAYCLDHYEDEDRRRDMQVQIDKRLRELQKKFPSHYIIVETPLADKPWPTYDEDPVEDILKLQERIGIDPEAIRRYEEENADRPEIVETMRALETEGQKTEIVVDAQT